MHDVKCTINSLALINVSVDFDELSIRVLNGLDPTYSNISHAHQVQETLINFKNSFKQLHSYEAQRKISVTSSTRTSTSALALVTLTVPSSNR